MVLGIERKSRMLKQRISELQGIQCSLNRVKNDEFI